MEGADDEQLVALANRGVVAVLRYLGPRLSLSATVEVAAADEAEHLAVVDDGEHGPVPEPVDESSGGRGLGHAGGDRLQVGNAVAPQMLHQCGPTVGGVACAESFQAG